MKKLVILFIMFISLLCIDINIVSAANGTINFTYKDEIDAVPQNAVYTYEILVYNEEKGNYEEYKNGEVGYENFKILEGSSLSLEPGKYRLMAINKYASSNMYFEPKKLTLKNGDKVIEKELSFAELDVMKENGTIDFEVKDNDNIEVEMLGNSFSTFTYVLKHYDADPNRYLKGQKLHYLKFFGHADPDIKYYKLVKEENGKRVYYPNDIYCTDEKSGTDECTSYDKLKVDLGGYTTIYIPFGTAHYFEYNGGPEKFTLGYVGGFYGSDSDYHVSELSYTDRIFYSNFLTLYSMKVLKKTDQEGRPADAKFNITFSNFYRGEETDPNTAGYKFTYKKHDELEINGKIYKNVYEVKDIIPKDKDDKDSIIDTKDGEAILYYPAIFSDRSSISTGHGNIGAYAMFVNEIDAETGYLKNEKPTILSSVGYEDYMYGTEEQIYNNGSHKFNRVKLDDFDIDTYVKNNWDNDGYKKKLDEYVDLRYDYILANISHHVFDQVGKDPLFDSWKQTRTVVNKKVPTIKKTIEGNGPKDKEYTFLVYEKESNELVEEIKVKANEEGYLDITKLVNGKTYIIREKIDSEDYTNTKIEVLNGEAKEDKDGKYYEFTYDEELTKVYEANFYNKYKEITVPDTGDNIIIFIVLGIVSLISILLVVLKLKKVNK